jgi:hypothetical protein
LPVVLSGALPVGLDSRGGHLLPFACRSAGPFDSLVGLTALTTLLVNGVVDQRRRDSSRRIGALERTWTTTGLFQA